MDTLPHAGNSLLNLGLRIRRHLGFGGVFEPNHHQHGLTDTLEKGG